MKTLIHWLEPPFWNHLNIKLIVALWSWVNSQVTLNSPWAFTESILCGLELRIIMFIIQWCVYMCVHCITIIRVSLSELHIDHDNVPRMRNNGMYLCIYLSIYLCIIYPAFVAPWFLRSVYALKCSMYSGILMCSCVWFTTACTQLNSEDDWSSSCLPWRLLMKTVRWMRRHYGIDRLSLLRQWSCSCPATCQRACVNQKWLMSLLYCCFVTFISTKTQHWTYYIACVLFVDVVQTEDTTDTAAYVAIVTNQLRLAPSIPWMH